MHDLIFWSAIKTEWSNIVHLVIFILFFLGKQSHKFYQYLDEVNPTWSNPFFCLEGPTWLNPKNRLTQFNWSKIGSGLEWMILKYSTCAIITRSLYFFYPIFHCRLYCRAVSVTDNICTEQLNSSILWV